MVPVTLVLPVVWIFHNAFAMTFAVADGAEVDRFTVTDLFVAVYLLY